MMTSDGECIEDLVTTDYERGERNRLRRDIDRKMPGGRNREKARITLAKAMERDSNRRNDFIHKVSLHLVDIYDTIAVGSWT